jgi:hypothetical protein
VLCECGKNHRTPYCRHCKNEFVDDINPDTWECIDSAVCAGILARRRENNELWQMLQRCLSAGALARKAARELPVVDPREDALLEAADTPTEDLDEYVGLQPRKRKPGRPRKDAPVPTGKCECGCAGKTKGGRFLPGHDAKLGAALVRQVKSGEADAYAELKRRGWLKKLPAALRAEWDGK